MDRDQRELQNLGFCGILKQSFKLVFSWRRVFIGIAVALILPLSILFLVDLTISQAITPKFRNNRGELTAAGLVGLWIFRAAYFTVLLVLSLLTTAAIVFTVAAAFAAKQVSFKTAMRAIPRVLKRLVFTFLICYAIVFVYNLVAVGIFALWFSFLRDAPAGVLYGVLAVLVVLFLAGIVYIAAVWNLAYVVSVLEDSSGLGALKKSKSLIKGKTWVSAFLVLLVGFCFVAVEFMFDTLVSVPYVVDHMAARVLLGIVAVILLVIVILVGTVIGTVLYFVCKSYHREDIDKSLLSDRLEVYVNRYIVLGQPNNVQLSTEARV